jgi:hypothetical protein
MAKQNVFNFKTMQSELVECDDLLSLIDDLDAVLGGLAQRSQGENMNWKKQAMSVEYKAAQQSVQLTALRFWLWVSICVHIISGIVLLYSAFGGN